MKIIVREAVAGDAQLAAPRRTFGLVLPVVTLSPAIRARSGSPRPPRS